MNRIPKSSLRNYLSGLALIVLATGAAIVGLAHSAGADVAQLVPNPTAGIDANDDPLSDSSPVYSVVEANGKFYVGGDFQTVAGETQPFLAAIDVATGRLDPVFRPDVNGIVKSIAASPDGSAIYVGGKFNKINNSYPSRIAKLDPITGEVDTSFDPDSNAVVETIVTDGVSVWAGGAFATIGGVARENLAKLDASGVVDPTFLPEPNGRVLDLELVGNRLYLAGNFTAVGGTPHERLASVDAQTGVVDAWAPASGFKVYDVSVHPDGSILYSAGAGSLRAGGNSLMAWDTTTGELLWRRVNSGDFQAVVATEELVYIGTHGEYVYIDNDGPFLEDDANPNAVRRNKLAAFNPLTGALDDWDPGANSVWGVWHLSVGPSGLHIGGDFITLGDVIQPHFAVLPGPAVGNISPTPEFTYTCDGATCTFDAANSLDQDGAITAYNWDFGDGQTATGVSAVVTLAKDTMHTVTLSVVDDLGASARTQNIVPIGLAGIGVDIVEATSTESASSTISAALPAEAEDGDLAVAFLATNITAPVITPPAGWLELAAETSGSVNAGIWYSPITAADADTSIGFGFDQTLKSNLTLATFRYVDLANPIAGVSSQPELSLWAQHSAPSITTLEPAAVLHFWADRTGDDAPLYGPADEALIARQAGVGGGHLNTEVTLETSSAAGVFPASVAIGGTSTRSAVGFTLALTVGEGPPPFVQTCTATLNGDNTITLTWDPIDGEDNYILRRNDSYLNTPGNTTTTTDDPGPGTWDYVVRSTLANVTTNTACTPTITIDPPPPFVQTCTATLNGDNTITLTWDPITGEDNYILRRNDSYLNTPGNTTTTTDDPGPGTWDYVVRSTLANVTTNTACTPTITIDPPPPFVQTCTATLNGDNTITLTWDPITGEDSYQVRRNDAWLTTTPNLTFTDVFAQPGDNYAIRSRINGVTTNTTCA